MKWTESDRAALARHGLSPRVAERQLQVLRDPPKNIELIRPAIAGDGITIIREQEMNRWTSSADEAADAGRVTKFVPASGAATRMFRGLTSALDPSESPGEEVGRFFRELDRFPFFESLQSIGEDRGIPVVDATTPDEQREVLRLLLTDEGLGYAALAKGLVLFHRYEHEARNAFEEQIREGVRFASDRRVVRSHFTVPERDLHRFSIEAARHAERIFDQLDIASETTFSIQHPSTDTIAATTEGGPFRDDEGNLLFRPGGHGALLRNLDEIGGDFVFIKNIDNIRPEPFHEEIARWYRVLIGYLAELERRTFHALRSLDEDPSLGLELVAELSRPWTGEPGDQEGIRRHVSGALNRPIRVCAAVRNEGEPGGAPFWVRDRDGGESLQIVESSQVDSTDADQMEVFRSSTHFNPVAIACSVRDRNGHPYELGKFVDHEAAIVTRKSHHGRDLFALEHPGLWNGSMAGWISIFVELPAFTFAPVKTVFDLLRPEHQVS